MGRGVHAQASADSFTDTRNANSARPRSRTGKFLHRGTLRGRLSLSIEVGLLWPKQRVLQWRIDLESEWLFRGFAIHRHANFIANSCTNRIRIRTRSRT